MSIGYGGIIAINNYDLSSKARLLVLFYRRSRLWNVLNVLKKGANLKTKKKLNNISDYYLFTTPRFSNCDARGSSRGTLLLWYLFIYLFIRYSWFLAFWVVSLRSCVCVWSFFGQCEPFVYTREMIRIKVTRVVLERIYFPRVFIKLVREASFNKH